MEVNDQLQTPVASPPGKTAPSAPWIGAWVGPRAGLDAVEKSLFPLPGIEPRPCSP
jgi:hypothetical protein